MHVRLSLPQIRTFLALAHAGSFREAAAAMGVSQPAFSRSIQAIEGRLGARLFDRDTRHVRLTAAGERLRPIAINLLKHYEEGFRDFENYVAGRSGRVRVASLPSVAALLLPPAVERFQATHPGVAIEFSESVGTPVHRMVEEGEADFGIAPPPASSAGLNFRQIFSDPLVLACREDDELAARDSHDWSVLQLRPFIAMPTDTGLRQLIDAALAEAEISVDPTFTCYPATAIAFVAASLGTTVLTRLTMKQSQTDGVTWRPLREPEVHRPIGLVTSPARSMIQPVRDLMREVEREARKLAF